MKSDMSLLCFNLESVEMPWGSGNACGPCRQMGCPGAGRTQHALQACPWRPYDVPGVLSTAVQHYERSVVICSSASVLDVGMHMAVGSSMESCATSRPFAF